MKIKAEPLTLSLRTPFRIAHGTSTTRQNVLVRIEDGVGVAAIVPYYATTVEDVIAYVDSPQLAESLGDDPAMLEDMLDRLPPGPAPARAAIDMALHDLWGKHLGMALWRLWGLNPGRAPLSSHTLGIAEEDEFRQRVREVHDLPILKIKLGTGRLDKDEALVRIARQETAARLCVDANAAWTVEEALAIIPKLAAYDLLFIEQPLAQHDLDGWRRLASSLSAEHPPLIADESVHDAQDILKLAGAADGINIKLAKCGGLREARRMIALARTLGMKVMLGCMVESSVGVTAAGHLAPLVDYADLDGNLTVDNDPYQGMRWEKGKLELPILPGLGVVRQ